MFVFRLIVQNQCTAMVISNPKQSNDTIGEGGVELIPGMVTPIETTTGGSVSTGKSKIYTVEQIRNAVKNIGANTELAAKEEETKAKSLFGGMTTNSKSIILAIVVAVFVLIKAKK